MTAPWTALGIPLWAVATVMACVILIGVGIKIGAELSNMRIEMRLMRYDICRIANRAGLDNPYSCSYRTNELVAQEAAHGLQPPIR